MKVKHYKNLRDRRIVRIRSKISGTSSKPRICVFRSNKYIYAQAIDDIKGHTLASFSSLNLDKKDKSLTKIEEAALVGEKLAEKLLKLGVKKAVFDRRGYMYHGRVKALADGAREGGLKF